MEVWKDIKGYEGFYQISDLGRVKSLERLVNVKGGKKKINKTRILKTTKNKLKYPRVTLSRKNIKVDFNVHFLVAEAFLFKKSKTDVIDHIDNNKLNNNLKNLQYITHRENASKDTFRYGKKSKYIGVSLREKSGVYESNISFKNKTYYLGGSKDEDLCYSYRIKALEFLKDNTNIKESEFKNKVKQWQANNRRS